MCIFRYYFKNFKIRLAVVSWFKNDFKFLANNKEIYTNLNFFFFNVMQKETFLTKILTPS